MAGLPGTHVNDLIYRSLIAAGERAEQDVRDDYDHQESLEDQNGDGAVLTFNFTQEVAMVLIVSDGANLISRATCESTETPTSTKGIRCYDEVPTYIPITTSVVKVFAPSGATVTVVGMWRD